MIKTPDGKWVVFDRTTGSQLERWPIDAKVLLDNDTHTAEPPEGKVAVVPKGPPRRVGVPVAKPAKHFEAPEGVDNG